MGSLTYDSDLTADFDDRMLAHLQLVIGAKLRRGESFFFCWKNDMPTGGGQTTIWLHPALAMTYTYLGSKMPMINRAWIEALTVSANSPGGLHLLAEPAHPDGTHPESPVAAIVTRPGTDPVVSHPAVHR
ncbi:MAG: ATP-dependent ligase [Glaciihabitans sp.]|nr:ATP-dependent ligase [Glaciihabitans sp.]